MTVPVLLLCSNDIGLIYKQLSERLAQTGDFFTDSPLLIDLQQLAQQNLNIEVDNLVAAMRDLNLIPVGLRGGNERQNEDALCLNLPVFSLPGKSKYTPKSEKEEQPAESSLEASSEESPPPLENKLITQPVRSGQRVYARGDLTVTTAVSAGAELLAEGSIHVYGTLRGRAMAGVRGNTESRIFCMDLRAELISIAGIYQLQEDLGNVSQQKPVSVSLENQSLVINYI